MSLYRRRRCGPGGPRSGKICMRRGEDLMVSISQCFSESYAEARPKFCSAAAAAGGALRSWLNPKARGPGGEALYLDTARFGPADAANMLVLIAGTHGVEGHCGSGARIGVPVRGGSRPA